MRDSEELRQFFARRARSKATVVANYTDDWSPEQRSVASDPSRLIALLCGRRAGKTRLLCALMLKEAEQTPGGRFLYINSTRGEAERIAWHGNRDDGIASLVGRYDIPAKLDQSKLSVHLSNGSWIYLRGADDEREMRKALGGAFHRVIIDEAQKIPTKLSQTLREVFMPTLLDFGGKLTISGSPSRQMGGLFYDVTRSEVDKRSPGWSVHAWTILNNPFFGASHDERWSRGVLELQNLYGGEKVAPIDSPIMQREAFGKWVREDSNYVYMVNKVPDHTLMYADARHREDGFPDVALALKDLPFRWQDGLFALGVDLGYNDPFTFTLWAWHPHDLNLYEVCSWKRSEMTSDEQNQAIQAVRAHVAIGVIDADAGGIGKQVVKGWSREWVERYGLPIFEAEKQHKLTAIQTFNNDIIRGTVKFRRGGMLLDEMRELQWATIVDGSGKMVEDPTMANDCCDGALYGHRRSFQYRWSPEAKKLTPGSPEAYLRIEDELEEDAVDAAEEGPARYH